MVIENVVEGIPGMNIVRNVLYIRCIRRRHHAIFVITVFRSRIATARKALTWSAERRKEESTMNEYQSTMKSIRDCCFVVEAFGRLGLLRVV
jgi:hypothetical protein